jgi:hypothetical protein
MTKRKRTSGRDVKEIGRKIEEKGKGQNKHI